MSDKENVIDDTEIRSNKVKLEYNEKLLKLAEESGDEEKIRIYIKNIEHYRSLLKQQ